MDLCLPICTLAVVGDGGPFEFFHTATGPEFLGGYLLWFIVLFAGSRVLQTGKKRQPLPSLAGLLLFEAVGLIRIIVGSSHGMHNWNFLILMMITGGMLFFARFENPGGSSGSSSGWSSSCSSSSCGGGGGGCG
ncbi:MAG: hypothetical protein ACKODH_17765, partial [Limisphaerales bacterium]